MLRNVLLGKIHRAVVTAADLNYVGSITVDPVLIEAAGMVLWERVQVVDVENGNRLETYIIPGTPGKGEIQLNGAAARLVSPGDHVIIMSYGLLSEEELATHRPRVVLVGEGNSIARTMRYGDDPVMP
ncbi:MAG: aspartate 1-decarboxylase [Anaerolineae bacterium]|nr:aspartate 1-decarboxylase [Anaerolineae bacterium]MCB0239684.1 aspartate 1-decarboxylase [Anaerolineae bacterium]MCB0248319.1 aspartate 1-decarboxylase [Anaerolineae bacterium]MCB9133109.1 aspartate 1-decarboxylase [Anaerolineales bacterium]MCO5245160.1 aspartate 1-decarboxylase [Anaerolineae bacterium]